MSFPERDYAGGAGGSLEARVARLEAHMGHLAHALERTEAALCELTNTLKEDARTRRPAEESASARGVLGAALILAAVAAQALGLAPPLG
ncbi:MAG: hypothetical protein AAFR16_06460 [Pseudomonadota bacterium]